MDLFGKGAVGKCCRNTGLPQHVCSWERKGCYRPEPAREARGNTTAFRTFLCTTEAVAAKSRTSWWFMLAFLLYERSKNSKTASCCCRPSILRKGRMVLAFKSSRCVRLNCSSGKFAAFLIASSSSSQSLSSPAKENAGVGISISQVMSQPGICFQHPASCAFGLPFPASPAHELSIPDLIPNLLFSVALPGEGQYLGS